MPQQTFIKRHALLKAIAMALLLSFTLTQTIEAQTAPPPEAIHSVDVEAPEALEVSESEKMDLPEDTHETVLCYPYSSGPFMGMPDPSRRNSYIRIVTRRIPGEDACLELSADGQLRTVPGTVCERPKLADRPCRENP